MAGKTFIALVVLWFSLFGYCFSRPSSSRNMSCSSNQVPKFNAKGEVECLDIRCPAGFGLTILNNYGVTVPFISGKIYQHGTKISCTSCLPRLTFSDRDDTSQCQNCTKCADNEISTGQCNIGEDSINCTGRCKIGFYRNDTKCLPCSQCCGDGLDVKPPDCSRGLVPSDTSCSVESKYNCLSIATTTSNTFTDITTTTTDTSKHIAAITLPGSDDGLEDSNETTKGPNNTNYTIVSLCVILVIATMITGLVVFKNTNSIVGRFNRYFRRYDNNFYTQVQYAENTSDAVVQLNTISLTTSHCQSVGSCGGSSVGSSSHSSVQADRGSIPSLGTPRTPLLDHEENTQMPAIPQDLGKLTEEEKLTLLVTQIPSLVFERICMLLDVLDVFYLDFRYIADHLGMEKANIDEIVDKPTGNPTATILAFFDITVKEFLVIIDEMDKRGDVSEVVQEWLTE